MYKMAKVPFLAAWIPASAAALSDSANTLSSVLLSSGSVRGWSSRLVLEISSCLGLAQLEATRAQSKIWNIKSIRFINYFVCECVEKWWISAGRIPHVKFGRSVRRKLSGRRRKWVGKHTRVFYAARRLTPRGQKKISLLVKSQHTLLQRSLTNFIQQAHLRFHLPFISCIILSHRWNLSCV